jgi:hypothetical protein
MDSDTMLTLENTNDAIKRAENYMQRQDTDGDKRVAFSSAVDDSTAGPDEVNTLRAKVLALEAKLDSFSHGQTDGGNKRKKPARKNEKECTYCKKAGKWFGFTIAAFRLSGILFAAPPCSIRSCSSQFAVRWKLCTASPAFSDV